jgi:UDP-N-acetylglucosamine:LPS N-acetylglucosamine transferase
MKVCVVSSCGGHLTEVRCLAEAFRQYDHFYVVNDKALFPADMEGRTVFITHSERDWRLLLNFWEAWKILERNRPSVILSTGASPAVPFAIIGKLFFGTKVIFVETITRISTPSLSGRIMYHLADVFFYQWESLAGCFPKGRFLGRVI